MSRRSEQEFEELLNQPLDDYAEMTYWVRFEDPEDCNAFLRDYMLDFIDDPGMSFHLALADSGTIYLRIVYLSDSELYIEGFEEYLDGIFGEIPGEIAFCDDDEFFQQVNVVVYLTQPFVTDFEFTFVELYFAEWAIAKLAKARADYLEFLAAYGEDYAGIQDRPMRDKQWPERRQWVRDMLAEDAQLQAAVRLV